MPLILGFAGLFVAILLIDHAITGAAWADILTGKSGQIYRANQAAHTSSSSSSAAAGAVSGVSIGAGGYVNPFAKAGGLVKERLDMGQDFHTAGAGQPIVSIGDAIVTAILPNWFRGQPLIMTKLTSGPQAGKLIYYAEGLNPTVKVGDRVRAGQQIATTTSQPTGLEFGWGGSESGQTLQQVTSPGSGDTAGAAASSFQHFLQGLGV